MLTHARIAQPQRTSLLAPARKLKSALSKTRAMDGAAHGTGPRKADRTRRMVDSSAFYVEAYHYFHQRLPVDLRAHRVCFSVEGRGVGADALHVTWLRHFGSSSSWQLESTGGK